MDELEENKYQEVEQALKPYYKHLEQTADTILDQEVSRYPIFVVHQLSVDLGVLLLEKAEEGPKWSVNATTLEELTMRNVIQAEKVDDFRRVFKDPRSYFCLFLLSDLGAQFVFLPRP